MFQFLNGLLPFKTKRFISVCYGFLSTSGSISQLILVKRLKYCISRCQILHDSVSAPVDDSRFTDDCGEPWGFILCDSSLPLSWRLTSCLMQITKDLRSPVSHKGRPLVYFCYWSFSFPWSLSVLLKPKSSPAKRGIRKILNWEWTKQAKFTSDPHWRRTELLLS